MYVKNTNPAAAIDNYPELWWLTKLEADSANYKIVGSGHNYTVIGRFWLAEPHIFRNQPRTAFEG